MREESALQRVLRAAIAALDRIGIEHHITGGLASSFYGEPRFTQHIDIVIRIEPGSVDRLDAELREEFLFDVESARRAVQRKAMFQALHRELVIKVDFHVGESCPGELGRSRRVTLFPGLAVALVSKEDALLSKLLWIQQGSGKSRQDVVGMLLDPTPYDEEFVQALAEQLGCLNLWHELVGEVLDR